jgi:hypothetical protein
VWLCDTSWFKILGAGTVRRIAIFFLICGILHGTLEEGSMTIGEKLDLRMKSLELEKQGKVEEAKKLKRSIPLAPYLAKFYKDHIGVDALLKSGWNLSEAEEEYGSNWLLAR